MISNPADIDDNVRGKRVDERPGEMRNHFPTGSMGARNRKVIHAFLACICFAATKPRAFGGDWFLLPEPVFMRHAVSFPILGAKSTVLAPARWTADGIEFITVDAWTAAGVDRDPVGKWTARIGSEWLAHVKIEWVRNPKKVVEFAVVQAEKFPVSVTVFAPEFGAMFEEVFGPRFQVIIPNRRKIFVFPGVATDLNPYGPMILEEWQSPAAKASLEVFQWTVAGLRAVGRIEEP